MRIKGVFFVLLLFPIISFAQKKPVDTVVTTEDIQNLDSLTQSAALIFTDTLIDRPNTAALYSALLPGLGQLYNGKPWKLPVIYSGFVLFGYIIKYNHDGYAESRAALFAIRDGDDRTKPKSPLDQLSEANIESRNDYFRRNRDFSILLTIAWYLLNIVDAHVDGHLNEFIITDDLSINIGAPSEPIGYSVANYGIALKINF